ncbi:hypothetical protein BI335_08955 [Enemella evansiae]|uniref:substrate-binding domain-containing protein n=1 Tax=Enemella evansiae TaxID=2016499 RepID=UPI000B962C94|nr:substrate-binding domain-containing protein [Enemella evansiae]OYO16883.1 hypothetical protein BI335_08955 [Enemella evansiae]
MIPRCPPPLRRALTAPLAVALVGVLAACDSTPAPVLPTPSSVYACPPGQLQVEGATSEAGMMNSYIASYAETCRNASTVVWTTSADSGRTSFVNGLVNVATSESWLSNDEVAAAQRRCQQNPAWHLPTTASPVAIVFRLDGVEQLTLSPETLAMIFSGQLNRWNDARIARENPGVTLPAQAIQVYYQNQPSGASEALGRYLARTAPLKWSPRNTTPNWRGQGQGRDRPEDVASSVAARSGTIGFLETAQLGDANRPSGEPQLGRVGIDEGQGPLLPTQEAASKALQQARFLPDDQGNDLRIDPASLSGEGAYPVVAVTYQIVCSQGLPVEVTSLTRDFLGFMLNPQTQSGLPAIGRVPLPDELRQRTTEAVAAIR